MNKKIGILIGMSFIMTGCGNALTATKLSQPATASSTITNTSNCSNAQTIKPVTSPDWGSYQSGTFSACQTPSSTGSGTTVSLNSPYTSGTQWCFIPAISNGVSRSYVNILGGVNPVIVCAIVGSHAATLTVPANVQFNSGYVFDNRDQAQMQNCLIQQNRSLCPANYAFGSL